VIGCAAAAWVKLTAQLLSNTCVGAFASAARFRNSFVLTSADLLLEGISRVDLSKNSFKGTLPETWLKIPSKLEFLNLASNQLTGTIPCKSICSSALYSYNWIMATSGA
jgi:hypothetical protein